MKLKLIAASISIALLAACEQPANPSNQSAAPKAEAQKAEPKKQAAEKALSSGVFTENFDSSVRPQDDFYRYVNGTWLKNTQIPDDRSNYGSFTVLAEKAEQDIKAIIEESAADPNKKAGSDAQKVGDLFNSVMDTATLEKLGVAPLKPYLDDIAAIKDKQALAAYMATVAKRGATAPFGMFVNNDAKQPDTYIVYLTQTGLGLPGKEYYFKDDEKSVAIRDAYVKHIEAMYGLAGLSNGAEAAKNVLKLETEIADAHWSKVDNRNSIKTYNKKEIAKMSELAGNFDWAAFFKAAGINESHIIVRQPSYIEAFDGIWAKTSLEDWKTYLTWHLLTGNAELMNKAIEDENFAFYGKTLSGTPTQKPRWKRGVDAINGLLGEMVGKVYVAKHFKPEAKERMLQLVENLRAAYGEAIKQLDWLSEETKTQALDKLSKFTPKIGYPDEWKDYSKLSIASDALLDNYMKAREFNYNLQLGKLGKPIDRNEWFMTPQTVNAYYNPVMNEIVFPAAILQPPFFDMGADDAVNYGAIGGVIGHEMGHGFDDQGASYDGDGVLRNWWTENDLAEFKKRTGDLVKQYDGFEALPDTFVNGEFTLGENIGDLGGLTIAYKAYQMSKGDKPAPEMDKFTGDQRFFIGWAQVWARKYRDEELSRRISTDPHSPSEFRANGVLRNMPEFEKAFNLKEGDKLYLKPEERVKIW
ncbi:M13 family metallopeptidase [Pleionea sp. CnH1-48]|uniref:M13 family metallopeptidase n=1 Tax=Pleionea sp. CnH1-48 TaxID=2954494 RepID=UPI0020984BF5|nr:M13-type metalloendopeptidase [Pleionea sp. CnH1-48]MCO7223933.1 hypothetical protein [Pleionea sp. CnH1-48]